MVASDFNPREKKEKENRPRDKEKQGFDILSNEMEFAFKMNE
jgi:hypothetical protein